MTQVEPDWDSARQAAFDSGRPLSNERIPLDWRGRSGSAETEGPSLGALADRRVLARDVVAGTALPPFATSVMDGWAVAGRGPWRVVGRVLAGDLPSRVLPGGVLRDGEAAGIATGAEVPSGTRGVLRSEHGRLSAEGLLFADRQPRGDSPPRADRQPRGDSPSRADREPGDGGGVCGEVPAGWDVRPVGEEAAAGEVLVPAGTLLTPVHLGIAAAAGLDELVVARQPTARVLVCGDELLRSGPARKGRVRDSLGPQLPAWLDRLGVRTVGVVRVSDTVDAHRAAFADADDVDLVVTTGGTAAGPADHLHAALAGTGGALLVDSVAVRPGHPMLLGGWEDGRRLLGLPGNPQSAVIGLLTLGAPLVAAMLGAGLPELGRVALAEPLAKAMDTRLVLARLAVRPGAPGGVQAHPVPYRGSGMLRGLGMADGFAVVPPGGAAAGSEVRWLPLPAAPAQFGFCRS